MKNINYMMSMGFFAALLVILYLATTTLEIKPLQNSWDKANHFLAFFVLYVLLYYSHFKLSTVSCFLLLFAFGVQIEIIQYFIPKREFSLLDVVADGIGLFLGVLFVTFVWQRVNAKAN
mgnify:CR=1 FL=1